LSGVNYHAWTHRPKSKGGTDPIEGFAIFAIKVFADDETTVVGDGAFVFDIPEDVDGARFVKCEAFVTTSGGSSTSIQIANNTQAVDMLTTPLSIDGGDLNSMDANTPYVVIDPPDCIVAWGDEISIDVDSGSGMGLGVYLYFMAAANAAVVLQGAQGATGATGGITDWTGQWQTATAYTANQSVSNNGSSYAAIDNHTSGATDEPGVGANWEDHWQLLAEQGTAGIGTTGWTDDSATTWTYASATTFTITGSNQTAKFSKGTRLQLTQSATVKYFVVTGSAFAGGDTTVTLTGGTTYSFTNNAVTANSYSYDVDPEGYPAHFTYTPTWSSSGTQPVLNNGTISGDFSVAGDVCIARVNLTAGSTTTYGTGTYAFSYPVAEVTYAIAFASGTGIGFDSSASATHPGFWRAGNVMQLATVPSTFWSNTIPFTWATGDALELSIVYRI